MAQRVQELKKEEMVIEVYDGWIIFYFMVGVLVSSILSQFLYRRELYIAAHVLNVFCLLAGIYCVAAGIFLAAEWQDPFANVSSQTLSRASVSGRGRGGLFILAIKYWPYILICYGGLFVLNMIGMSVCFIKRESLDE